MADFKAGDVVWVNADDHYLDGGQYTLYAVDDKCGYIDHDDKAWCVEFEYLEHVNEEAANG